MEQTRPPKHRMDQLLHLALTARDPLTKKNAWTAWRLLDEKYNPPPPKRYRRLA